MSMVAMQVVGVRIEMPSNQPIVLLKEIDGVRFLPIWVGAVEATAIAFAQQGVVPPRPLTHDLMQDIVESLDATLTAVQVTAMEEGVFMASLLMRDPNGNAVSVSARPSDAIALALRTHSNILADSDLLDSVGIEIPEDVAQDAMNASGDSSEMERFREFLDQINPEDFAG
jgi:bifunctional DNase/RNase